MQNTIYLSFQKDFQGKSVSGREIFKLLQPRLSLLLAVLNDSFLDPGVTLHSANRKHFRPNQLFCPYYCIAIESSAAFLPVPCPGALSATATLDSHSLFLKSKKIAYPLSKWLTLSAREGRGQIL